MMDGAVGICNLLKKKTSTIIGIIGILHFTEGHTGRVPGDSYSQSTCPSKLFFTTMSLQYLADCHEKSHHESPRKSGTTP